MNIEARDIATIVALYNASHPELAEVDLIIDVQELIDAHLESSYCIAAHYCQKLPGNNVMLVDFDPKANW